MYLFVLKRLSYGICALIGLSMLMFVLVRVMPGDPFAKALGEMATKEQAEEMHKFIRGKLTEMYNDDISDSMRIQYGGSVKPDNVAELMGEPDIDGALVGGASLDADSFIGIVLYDK